MLSFEHKSHSIKLPKNKILRSEMKLVGKGTDREVFYPPDYPAILFKVLLPVGRIETGGLKGWMIKNFPSLRSRAILGEYKSAIQIQIVKNKKRQGDIPISRLYGFIETDIGYASIVERIYCEDKEIGPNLRNLYESGSLTKEHIELLNDFSARLRYWRVRTTDLCIDNVVYGTSRGRPQFVLVDGIGDNFVIPLRTWSLFVTERSNNKRLEKN